MQTVPANRVSPDLISIIRLLVLVEVIFKVKVSLPVFIVNRSPRMFDSLLLFFGKGESKVEIGIGLSAGASSACLQDKHVIKINKMMVFSAFINFDADS